MTVSSGSAASERGLNKERRSRSTLAAFILGMPLAYGILFLIDQGLIGNEEAQRYIRHGVERVEVFMFCGAFCALFIKMLRAVWENRALGVKIVPPWDGKAVPP